MRLLQVMGGAGPGGAERFFARLAAGLAEAGIDQKLVVRRGADCLNDLHQNGLGAACLPFITNFDLFTRWRLKHIINDYLPDIVMTWMNRASLLCPSGKFIHVARLGGYYDLKYYNNCDHLVGNTEDIVEYCRRNGWSEERTHYLPNFADEERMPALPRQMLGVSPDTTVLLALGRLHDDKAFDILLRALALLPDLHLWLTGEGPRRGYLESLAHDVGVSDRVQFLGWRRDIAALLASADCLVCPSRIEPLGNVILEGWALEKPVVAADSEGPASLIKDGYSGLLVPREDVEGLATALLRVTSDANLARTIAAGGYAVYSANFSKRAVTQLYIDFFARLMMPCVE